MERDKNESKDYYVLFRDTEVPELTNSDYENRCAQEDLLPADKATYVWGHIDALPNIQAKFVQRSLDKQLEDEFKEKDGLSNASVPCQFGYELAVYFPLASILKKLSKVSPNLAFLFNVQRLPLQRFWYFPESDDESWQIRQLLESQTEQDGRGIFWHLHKIEVPKTDTQGSKALKVHIQESKALKTHFHTEQTLKTRTLTQAHRSFAQVLSLDTIVDSLKRVGFRKEMDVARRAAAVWVIETSLAYEKLTSPGFTRVPPFTTPPILSEPLSDPRAAFELAIADEKYLPTLSDRQLAVLERGVTIFNNIMTSFRPAHKKIANKYEAMRLNNEAKRARDEEQRIEAEKKRILEEEKKNAEEKRRISEAAKRVSDKINSPFPHLMEAASVQSASDITIDGNTTGIEDTGNPLHVKDVAVIDAIKEHVEATREQTELLKKLTARDMPLEADTRTVEYSEKALEQKAQLQAPMIDAINKLHDATVTASEASNGLLQNLATDFKQHMSSVSKNSETTEKPQNKTLEPPKTKLEYEKILAGIYQKYPDTKTLSSEQLLEYLKNWASKKGVQINISASRIRKLEVWKENAPHRQSGKTRYGYNPDHFASDDEDGGEA